MAEETSLNFLRKIGLTESEIKVYIAMLKLGTSSKGKLIKESGIAHSKIYEVADKLINKGLCSMITKSGVRNFMAAPPSRIKDYLNKKHKEIIAEEHEFSKIMPRLESYCNKMPKGVKVEMFIGWNGVETAYLNLLELASKKEQVHIIGAGTGKNEKKLELFFTKYSKIAFKKDLEIKVIFNENARKYVSNIEKNLRRKYKKKFLFEQTPTEILVFRERTAIIIWREEPLVVLIKDKETSNSFKKYFAELWKIARK